MLFVSITCSNSTFHCHYLLHHIAHTYNVLLLLSSSVRSFLISNDLIALYYILKFIYIYLVVVVIAFNTNNNIITLFLVFASHIAKNNISNLPPASLFKTRSPSPRMLGGGGNSEGGDGGEGQGGGIPHMMAGEAQDLYALPLKAGARPPVQNGSGSDNTSTDSTGASSTDSVEEKQEDTLPPGWEKHEGQSLSWNYFLSNYHVNNCKVNNNLTNYSLGWK